MSAGAHDVAREVRDVIIAWRIVRTDPSTAEWRQSMPVGIREALDRMEAAYSEGRLGSP